MNDFMDNLFGWDDDVYGLGRARGGRGRARTTARSSPRSGRGSSSRTGRSRGSGGSSGSPWSDDSGFDTGSGVLVNVNAGGGEEGLDVDAIADQVLKDMFGSVSFREERWPEPEELPVRTAFRPSTARYGASVPAPYAPPCPPCTCPPQRTPAPLVPMRDTFGAEPAPPSPFRDSFVHGLGAGVGFFAVALGIGALARAFR